MPGNGCPIRDDGRIVRFGLLPRPSDPPGLTRLHVDVVSTSCGGKCTWSEVWSVDLQKQDNDWKVVALRQLSIT